MPWQWQVRLGASKMGTDGSDFLPWLREDLSFKILTSLEEPSDLLRASHVSGPWRRFVVGNSLFKQMCLRMFPQLSEVDRVIEPQPTSSEKKLLAEVGPSDSSEGEDLKRENRVYAFLACCCSKPIFTECISEAISSSSTDNYPEESIHNTLEKRDRVGRRASYWSSKGNKNPSAPERLIYNLAGDLCIVNEIGIQPFRVYFEPGRPIYSAKSVRFRMGFPKESMDNLICGADNGIDHDKFVWTYTSPEFPMAQENLLQKFKLPEPVLCTGGFLLVELLGRVQREEIDGLFYICISHVEVLGFPLSPALGVELIEPKGKFALKVRRYDAKCLKEPRDNCTTTASQRPHMYLNMRRGNVVDVDYDWEEEQDEEEDDLWNQ